MALIGNWWEGSRRVESQVEKIWCMRACVFATSSCRRSSSLSHSMWPFSSSSSKSELHNNDPAAAAGCPVDHTTRQKWLDQHKGEGGSAPPQPPHPIASSSRLSEEREVSSIPRWFAHQQRQAAEAVAADTAAAAATTSTTPTPTPPPVQDGNGNWVYPSPAQFHAALQRKGRSNHKESDMNVVVPIHNAVNEKCWQEILKWEHDNDGGKSQRQCGGPKLVSFKGKPTEVTWKAWMKGLLGYQAPFDRHDWVVDRCGHRIRYIIDFYAGRAASAARSNNDASQQREQQQKHPFASKQQQLSFYLDVRPAPDTLEGITMRIRKMARDVFSGGSTKTQ